MTDNNYEDKIKTLQRRIHSPKTDLLENDNYIIVRMELPVHEINWEILNNNILLVSYEKRESVYKHDNLKVIYSETKYGKGMRRVKLPCEILNDAITNEWCDGIFILCFRKKDSFNLYTIDNGVTINWHEEV